MYFVSRQIVWPEGNKVVEVVSPGLDHAGPGMLTEKFKNLGEGQEFASPVEAFEAANQVRNAWRRLTDPDDPEDDVTIEFMGETGTDEELGAKAEALEAKLPKCDQCGDVLPAKSKQYRDYESGAVYCSRECADRAAEFEEAEQRRIDQEYDDQVDDGDEDDKGDHEYSGSVRAEAAQQLLKAAKLLLAADEPVADEAPAAPTGKGSDDFIEAVKSQLKIKDRRVRFNNKSTLGGLSYADVIINYINLPTGVGSAGGGAEAENNRMLFFVEGFGKETPHTPPPRGKVRIRQEINMVTDRSKNLRAKTGTPEQIAKYLADYLNKIAAEVEPRFTHTKVES